MNGLAQRLLPAAVIALILHGALLCLQLSPDRPTPARPLAVQRIAVSLGSPRVVEKKAPADPVRQEQPRGKKRIGTSKKTPPAVPGQSPAPGPAVLAKSEPSPAAEKIVRKKTPPRSQQKKTVPARRQQVAGRHLTTTREDAQRETPVAPKPAVTSSSRADPEDENSRTAPAAARVIQRATPLYRINPPPGYPRLARRRGLEGVVLLEVLVDISGKVADLRVDTSSGHAILDRAALKAVRRWRFTPATIDGHRRQMWVKVPVRFQLQ